MGGSRDGANPGRKELKPEAKGKTHKCLEVAAPAKTAMLKTPKIHKDKEVSLQQIIPLDDDDFKDF